MIIAKVTGGEAMVQSLLAHGVNTIFGLPGVQNDYLYNALYDASDKPRLIHTRHKQGAAFLVLRQAMRQGFATSGPTIIEIPVGEMPNPCSVSFLPRVRPAAR